MFSDSVHGARIREDELQEHEDFFTRDNEEEKSKFDTYRNSARIYIALIIGVGIVGNTACLVLYRRPSFCRYRSSRYLTALAISDLTSLICLGLIWLKGLGVPWQDRSDFVCAASIYASNSATFLSAWFVMLLTADMAWALRRPYRVNMFEKSKSIVGRILATTFVGLVANSWTWTAAKISNDQAGDIAHNLAAATAELQWMVKNGSAELFDLTTVALASWEKKTNGSAATIIEFQTIESGCQLTFNDDEYFARCMIIFDMMVSFTIPLVITLILNGYVGYKLMNAAQKRRYLTETVRAVRRSSSARNRNSRALLLTDQPLARNHTRPLIKETDCADLLAAVVPLSISRVQVRRRRRSLFSGLGKEATVSSLLIAKSLTYLILNLPTHAYRLWTIFREPAKEEERESEFLVNMVVYTLFYTQFSLNFLLYSGHACRKRGKGSI